MSALEADEPAAEGGFPTPAAHARVLGYSATGYKVVRVPFKDGKPQGYYQNFVTGFWVSGQHRAEVWGRPAALALTKDGALLIADDTGGTIWRIAYNGPKAQTGQPVDTTGNRPN